MKNNLDINVRYFWWNNIYIYINLWMKLKYFFGAIFKWWKRERLMFIVRFLRNGHVHYWQKRLKTIKRTAYLLINDLQTSKWIESTSPFLFHALIIGYLCVLKIRPFSLFLRGKHNWFDHELPAIGPISLKLFELFELLLLMWD